MKVQTTIPQPEVTEPRDAAERRIALDNWLKAWHAANPGQVHPEDIDATEWAETRPADIKE